MSKPRFYLIRNKDPNATSGIYMRLKRGKQVFKYGIGKSIIVELWNPKEQRPTNLKALIKSYSHISGIGIDLENIDARIHNVIKETKSYLLSKELTSSVDGFDGLRDHLNSKFNTKVTKTKKLSFIEYADQFIDDADEGRRKIIDKRGQRKYTKSTIKTYRSAIARIKSYQKDRFVKLQFESMKDPFYKDLVNYLSEDYSPNYIGGIAKFIKKIMEAARKEGLHINDHYRGFKKPSVEAINIYLNESELTALKSVDLSNHPKGYEMALDSFLLGVYSLQRISDYQRFNPQMIKEIEGTGSMKGNQIKVIELIQKKTGTKVMIPLNHELDRLLKKYDYSAPDISAVNLNVYIKEIAKLAKINSPVVGTELLKYQMCSSHTGRRSGITNLYKKGIPVRRIRFISGHGSDNQFYTYVKTGLEETAESLANDPKYMGESTLRAVS